MNTNVWNFPVFHPEHESFTYTSEVSHKKSKNMVRIVNLSLGEQIT